MRIPVGSRAAYPSAMWFVNILGRLCSKVHSVLPYMVDITGDSVVFCISFSRYSRGSHQCAKQDKDRRAKLNVITDDALSPIGLLGHYIFITDSNENEMEFNSYVSPLCIGSLIVCSIRCKEKGLLSLRLASFEDICKEIDIFYE